MKRKEPLHWAWFILTAGFLTVLVSLAIRLGYGVILPEMIRSMRLSKTEGGMIYGVFLASYTLFAPIAGNLNDRFGGRKVITLFCAILSFGLLMVGISNQLFPTILFFAIAGIGISSTWAPVVSLTTKWFSANKRGFVLGVLMVGGQVGYGLVGLLFPLITVRHHWRFAWTILGISAVVVTAVNGLLLRNKPEELGILPWGEKGKSLGPSIPRPSSYLEILKKKIFWQIGISYFFISFCYYTFVSFIVSYGNMELGIGYGTASAFASVFAFGALAGSLPISMMSDFLGRSRTIIMSQLVIAGSVAFLLLAQSNLWMIFISIGVYGIFFGPIFPLYGACSRDHFEVEVTGTVLGAWTFLYGMGAILAPLVAGSLADLTGTFRWGFAFAGIAALISSALMCRIGK
jgi:MFS family permease